MQFLLRGNTSHARPSENSEAVMWTHLVSNRTSHKMCLCPVSAAKLNPIFLVQNETYCLAPRTTSQLHTLCPSTRPHQTPQ